MIVHHGGTKYCDDSDSTEEPVYMIIKQHTCRYVDRECSANRFTTRQLPCPRAGPFITNIISYTRPDRVAKISNK
eukprot:755025-Hanusia_phi.AAC.1